MTDDSNFEACHKAFDIPEIAEIIFAELHVYDIIISAIRVCKHWKAIIDNSMKLQQLLFMRPISATRLQYFDDDNEHPVNLTGRWSTSAEDPGIYKIYTHPLLTFMSDNYTQEGANWAAIRRPEASWCRALATQPPATQIEFDNSYVAWNETGVNMQEIARGSVQDHNDILKMPTFDPYFRREEICGEQEFEIEVAYFSDLQDML